MLWVEDEHGNLNTLLNGLEFWPSPIVFLDSLCYSHLQPGTEALVSIVLPSRDFFPHDEGKVTARLAAFVNTDAGQALPRPVVSCLYVDEEDAVCLYINPTTWQADILQWERLGAVRLHRDQVLTVQLSRPEHDGQDVVALVGVSFIVEPA